MKKEKLYSIAQIVKIFAGNPKPSMPFVKGKVPYCKFDPKLNPNLPNEAWVEEGPMREKAAIFLASKRSKTPVFIKKGTNKWQYIGDAYIKTESDQKKLKRSTNHLLEIV